MTHSLDEAFWQPNLWDCLWQSKKWKCLLNLPNEKDNFAVMLWKRDRQGPSEIWLSKEAKLQRAGQGWWITGMTQLRRSTEYCSWLLSSSWLTDYCRGIETYVNGKRPGFCKRFLISVLPNSHSGVLTSVVLQQDYGGVDCASARINRAVTRRHAALNVSEGRILLFPTAFWWIALKRLRIKTKEIHLNVFDRNQTA